VHVLQHTQVFCAHVGWLVMVASLMAEAVLLNVAELHIMPP